MKKEGKEYLQDFSRQIIRYRALMEEAFDSVINEGVSKYPVFIFHRQEVNVGIPIAERDKISGDWSVNISTLEEFYIKGLVTIEQVDEIKLKIAGDSPKYCCLVLSGEEASLVFPGRGLNEK